jgi:para-nitrobenzyl esterase
MMSYWSNFARSGDPNGSGLPSWPRYEKSTGYQVMHLDETSNASPDTTRKRYETIDAISGKSRPPGSAQ